MKYIKLTQGFTARICDCHYDLVKQYKWCAMKGNRGRYYAFRSYRLGNGHQKSVLMHRLIMGNPPGVNIDHHDGDTMHNNCDNLRPCNQTQNNGNQHGAKKGSKSGYKGVYWHKAAQKWCAEVVKDHKKYYLGLFKNKLDAAEAYNKKAKELYGDYFAPA